jgi:hypothetical protein
MFRHGCDNSRSFLKLTTRQDKHGRFICHPVSDLWAQLLRLTQPCGIVTVVTVIFCIYLMWQRERDCRRHDQSQKDMIALLDRIISRGV